MKINRLFKTAGIISAMLLVFTSCKKDDPVHEHDNEEIANLTLTFTRNDGRTDVPSEEKVSFLAGQTDQKDITLHKGAYNLVITAFDLEGHPVHQEIAESADEHQFFFVGPTKEQVSYTYSDATVGLSGVWTALQTAERIPVDLVLMHGLNKSRVSAADWNNANYFNLAGGSVDVRASFTIKVID